MAALPCQARLEAGEQKKRTAEIEQFVRVDLKGLEAALGNPAADIFTRDLSHAALAYLMLEEGTDRGLEKAEADLRLFFKNQNMDSSSPYFGSAPWNLKHPEVQEENAIEFTASALAPLFLLYADRFPAPFLAEAAPHLHAALAAIARHNVKITYTNIALMKLTNQILLGEYLNDAATIAAGNAMLDAWIENTRANGVSEFDSPTYSQTQMSVLYDLYHNTRDPAVKAKAKAILDYYWADLAANFFSGSKCLSGPYSRCYDFLTHDFNLSQIYYLNGIPAAISTDRVYLNDEVQIWLAAVWNDYAPPDSALAEATEPVRLVQQRFGALPGQDRTNYITPDFALGSASRLYGPQDRLVTAALASAKGLPSISVIPDEYDAPYGQIKALDKGGHRKIHHLMAPISAVQNKEAVLAILNLAPAVNSADEVATAATDVLVPLQADAISVDGKRVDWGNDGAVPLTADSVVGIREGNGAVAIRLFAADAAPGSTTSYYLKNDGKKWNTGRVVAYQYNGPKAHLHLPSLRSGVLLLAAHCATEAEFHDFLDRAGRWSLVQSDDGHLWRVTAEAASQGGQEGEKLEVSMDDRTHQPGPRLVNGRAVAAPALSINGIEQTLKIAAAPGETEGKAKEEAPAP